MRPGVIITLIIWNMLLTLATMLLCYLYTRQPHNRVSSSRGSASTSSSRESLGDVYGGVTVTRPAAGSHNKYKARNFDWTREQSLGDVEETDA